MIVSRLVEIGFAAFGGKTELLFEFLPSNASLEDTMELFGVDV
jgi:hypothetical protein